jgi:hypothetical protein
MTKYSLKLLLWDNVINYFNCSKKCALTVNTRTVQYFKHEWDANHQTCVWTDHSIKSQVHSIYAGHLCCNRKIVKCRHLSTRLNAVTSIKMISLTSIISPFPQKCMDTNTMQMIFSYWKLQIWIYKCTLTWNVACFVTNHPIYCVKSFYE